MSGEERTRNICGALWRLLSAARSRSEVSVDDVVRESGHTREEVDACITQDNDIREIVTVGGFSRIMREEHLVHA